MKTKDTTDPIVESVVAKLQKRSQEGIKKYKTTLYDSPEGINVFLDHLQEELLDAANYIETLKHKLLLDILPKRLQPCDTAAQLEKLVEKQYTESFRNTYKAQAKPFQYNETKTTPSAIHIVEKWTYTTAQGRMRVSQISEGYVYFYNCDQDITGSLPVESFRSLIK